MKARRPVEELRHPGNESEAVIRAEFSPCNSEWQCVAEAGGSPFWVGTFLPSSLPLRLCAPIRLGLSLSSLNPSTLESVRFMSLVETSSQGSMGLGVGGHRASERAAG